MGKFIDLTGQKFGRLTVVKRTDDYIQPNGRRRARWLCKCSCGNHKIVTGDNLKNNSIKSCGCLNIEKIIERSKKYNIYDLSGEYGIGNTSKGEKFYFDLEDYEKIKDYCWRINNDGYVVSNRTLLHRLIMGVTDKSIDIDHIHGEATRYDNRKINLRVATRSQNCMNRRLLDSNTSGVTGVCYEKRRNKWMAYIGINRRDIFLGLFDNFDDAVKARKEAEEKYFGEYSYDNSLKISTN